MRHDLRIIDCNETYVRYGCNRCGKVFRAAKDFDPAGFAGECGMPSLTTQVKNVSRDGWKWARGGFKLTDREERDRRLGICLTCEEYLDGRCRRCGCKCEWKKWLRTSECPLGKWVIQPPIPKIQPRRYWRRPEGDRICVGVLTPTLMMGGAEMWAVSMVRRLGGEGVSVEGLGIMEPSTAWPEGRARVEEVCRVYERRDGILELAGSCDVIVTWGIVDLSMLAGYEGVVVQVGQGHCNWTTHVVNSAVPYTTHWVAVSRAAAQSFPDPGAVTVIHNSIDAERCEPRESREAVRKRWGLKPEEVAVGYVGRFGAEKNPLANVRAVKLLGPPYRAVWVGGGEYTKVMLPKGRAILPDLVHQPPMINVGDAYRALDCFVLASPSEGFSLAMAEAWYCGCPMVHTPVGGTEVQGQHGPMGVEVPVDPTPEQVAEAVEAAVSPANRPLVEKAKRIAVEHYMDEAMGRRWREYLRGIFDGRGTGNRAEADAPTDVFQLPLDVQV